MEHCWDPHWGKSLGEQWVCHWVLHWGQCLAVSWGHWLDPDWALGLDLCWELHLGFLLGLWRVQSWEPQRVSC